MSSKVYLMVLQRLAPHDYHFTAPATIVLLTCWPILILDTFSILIIIFCIIITLLKITCRTTQRKHMTALKGREKGEQSQLYAGMRKRKARTTTICRTTHSAMQVSALQVLEGTMNQAVNA
jgi:hypothetical protein